MSAFDWLPWLRARRTDELTDELRAHLEMAQADRVARGESPDQAAANARREFGNPDLVCEVSRDQWGAAGLWLDHLAQDVRFAFRSLLRRRAYTAAALITLAIGIGATTSIFSAVNAVLLRPLPFPNADRIVMVWGTLGGQRNQALLAAYTDIVDWAARSHTLEKVGIMRGQSVNLTGVDTPDRLVGMFATPEVFDILGARVATGRLFTLDEARPLAGAPVVVLSHAAWQTRFGGDPRVVGRTLVLNGTPHVVIGVLSSEFQPPLANYDVWLPISSVPSRTTFDRGVPNVWGIARLRSGVTVADARRDLDGIAAQLEREFPSTNRGAGAFVQSLRDQIAGPTRASLLTIFAAVALLLLIACANVANLQLARAATRAQEIAVRTALGAARGRIIRQLLTESAVLALVGGAMGVLLARWAIAALVAIVPGGLPAFGDIGIDGRVLSFALAASAFSALVFGLAPAIRASRGNLRAALGSRGASGGRRGVSAGALINGAQLALCTALLIVGGLLTRSLGRLRAVDPGFDASNVLGAEFRLPPSHYSSDTARADFFARAVSELRTIPGARSAALVSSMPLSGNFGLNTYEIAGRPLPRPETQPRAYLAAVSDGFFATMRIPLLAGRDVDARDRLRAPWVVLVNQTLARREWPNAPAVGKRMRMTGDTAWSTVIGVVGDVKEMTLAEPPTPQVYRPLSQTPGIFASVALRTERDPGQFVDALRHAIWRVDKEQPVWRIRPLVQSVDVSTQQQQFTAELTVIFAVIALVLGAVGVYGVMSHAMAQRTREIGLRLALGAPPARVLALVVRSALRLSVVAAAGGMVLAALAGRALSAQLFGVSALDAVTFSVVPVILLAVAALAAYVPARRASLVDPTTALRSE